MGLLTVVIVGLVAFWIIARKIAQYWKQKSIDFNGKSIILPPAPRWSVPIFGHMWMLHPKQPYQTVWRWGEKYGPVFRAQFGPDMVVILHTYDAIKEAFVHQADTFAGRPHFWLFDQLQEQSMRGIINTQGDKWKEQRRFTLSRLRDSGLGRPEILSGRIQNEIEIMLSQFSEKLSTRGPAVSIDIIKEMRYTVANIISSICFGYTFNRGDPEFENFQSFMDQILKIVGLAGPLLYFPWMRHLVPGNLGFEKLLTYAQITMKFYQRQMDRHKMSVDRLHDKDISNNDDFIAAYMKEMHRKKTGDNPKSHHFNDLQLKYILGDLFFAGQETTVTTLRWALMFLLKHPEIQEKCYKEMRGKIGTMPNLQDRNKLPYLQAVVMEAQRLGNIIPFGVMHATNRDTTLYGYHIPRGTTIIPNIWGVHLDESLFPNPHDFYPSRFLNSDDTLKTKVEGFIPFSMGKRTCLGEYLAKAELFTILAAILYNYTVCYDETQKMPGLEPELGTTLSTEYFFVTLKKR